MRSFLIVETQPRQGGTAFLVVHVSGKLAKEDYENFVPEFDRLARGMESCASCSI